MLSILASYAQDESLSNSENMKWRIHSNFQNGLAWNPTLLGYRYDHGSYTYTGNLLLQKNFSEDHLSKKKRYNKGELPMYRIQDSHEVIIPLEQFQAVQEEIRRRAEKHSTPPQNPIQRKKLEQYPVSGIIPT